MACVKTLHLEGEYEIKTTEISKSFMTSQSVMFNVIFSTF